MKHAASIGGIECVALGTDFDGIEGHKEIPGAGHMEKLIDAMDKEGLTKSEQDKILGENVLRVYKMCL